MNSVHLQAKVKQALDGVGMKLSQPQVNNLALWCQTLAVSENCHLTNLALGLPLAGEREHLIQRLRRFLKQRELGWNRCYGTLVRHLFDHWQGREVALVMDRTDLADRWSLLLLGVAYRKRLLPLAWRVLPFGGTSAEVQISLLRQVQPFLPATATGHIHFYADCEFRAVSVQAVCQAYQWHWQVGVKSDSYVQLPTGQWRQLRDLGVQPGERRYWQHVTLTQQHPFGPVNLLADWSAQQQSPRDWVTDLAADPQAWRRGRKRFWIEPSFRDWKSYGFDLEQSQLADPARLEVLVLGMAVTTLWMIHLGDWLRTQGHAHWLERELDAVAGHDFSLFRLGRDYLKRAQTMNWRVPVGFTVSHA
jgi:hypothetical protein